MRLRYLHVAHIPPLDDVQIVFRQEPLLHRSCAIRFVVGVNGTGKTHLLLALTEIFLHLERGDFPPFPVTLAYDLGTGKAARTILVHTPMGGKSGALFVEFAGVLEDRDAADWETLAAPQSEMPLFAPDIRTGPFQNGDLPGGGSIYGYLPPILLAYTSGALDPWQTRFTPPPPERVVAALPGPEEMQAALEDEAPAGWDAEKENARREREFIEDLRERIRTHPNTTLADLSVPELVPPPQPEDTPPPSTMARLVTPDLLRYAVCAVTLQQLATEVGEYGSPEALETAVHKAVAEGRPQRGLRGLLDEIGWLWPVSLHLTLHGKAESIPDKERPWWQRLYGLSSAVINEPGGGEKHSVSFDLSSVVKDDTGDRPLVAALIEHLTLASGGPYGVFERLCALHAEGRLVQAHLTVRKRDVDDLLLYDWLSDGERMFLGRMALFHLLRGQDDALLILDEPETHFNDIWKRRIVDIIDDNLRDNANEVIISTHSSITLTDAFDEEITKLEMRDGGSRVGRITTPTFGADPSEIMITVFDAPESIGERALEYLDGLLRRPWRTDQRDELERIIRNIGPGYHRSELRTIWRGLSAPRD